MRLSGVRLSLSGRAVALAAPRFLFYPVKLTLFLASDRADGADHRVPRMSRLHPFPHIPEDYAVCDLRRCAATTFLTLPQELHLQPLPRQALHPVAHVDVECPTRMEPPPVQLAPRQPALRQHHKRLPKGER